MLAAETCWWWLPAGGWLPVPARHGCFLGVDGLKRENSTCEIGFGNSVPQEGTWGTGQCRAREIWVMGALGRCRGWVWSSPFDPGGQGICFYFYFFTA